MKKLHSHISAAIFLSVALAVIAAALSPNAFSAHSFGDVTETDWYASEISALSEAGIINGYPDGTFRPMAKMTNGEFMKLLCIGLSLDGKADTSVFSNLAEVDVWYEPYVAAALSNGILFCDEFEDGKFPGNEKISRLNAAKYVYRALGISALPYHSPYADTDSPYPTMLYSEMLMQGSINGDGERVFNPDSMLSRAECCAVISRAMSYKENVFAYKKSAAPEFTGKPLTVDPSPSGREDFALHILNMLKSGELSRVFDYNGVSFGSAKLEDLKNSYTSAFALINNSRPEYSSLLSTRITIKGNNAKSSLDVEIITSPTYSTTLAADELSKLNLHATSRAKTILHEIKLAYPDASPMDIANAIHDYLVLNTEYDTSAHESGHHTSYLAYGALVDGKAVCQGYSAAFNLLCEVAGINSYSVAQGGHMWNIAMIDGLPLIYDVTWDDPIPDIPGEVCNEYRGIVPEKIKETHPLPEHGEIMRILR